jgi:hypothetical protein
MMPWGFWMGRRFFIKNFLSVFGLCIVFLSKHQKL